MRNYRYIFFFLILLLLYCQKKDTHDQAKREQENKIPEKSGLSDRPERSQDKSAEIKTVNFGKLEKVRIDSQLKTNAHQKYLIDESLRR